RRVRQGGARAAGAQGHPGAAPGAGNPGAGDLADAGRSGGEGVKLGGGQLLLIAGPCVIEGEEFTLRHARRVAEVAKRQGGPAVFKCSFDKANRSSGKSFRGPGLVEGLRILSRVKQEVGLPVLTDVHETSQCARAAEVVDVLQIPAFLSRQTDLLLAAGATGR